MKIFGIELKFNGFDIWHKGNQGSGSTLDADTVDGRHASSFAYSETGNADLNTIIQSGMYRINSSLVNAPSGVDWGQLLVIHGNSDTITQIVTDYGSTNMYWRSGNPTNVGGTGSWGSWRKIWHDGNDGAGSGLDADLLDGSHASAFATSTQGTKADNALPASSYTESDVLAKIKTVDGSGSGLDADTVDGKHASDLLERLRVVGSSINIDNFTEETLYTNTGGVISGTLPPGGHNGKGFVHFHTHDGNYHTQIAVNTNTNNLHIRSADNGPWGPWRTFWNDGNDGSGSGMDADKLDGQEGSFYQDWTNVTNKPDPTITLGGNLTGSVTLTDLASGTLTATVVDDSHNHIISNIDNLQSSLDLKANLASPTFTGTPTAPTAATSDSSTQIATTAFIKAQGYITSAGSGAKIAVSTTAPASTSPGDFWYKEV